MDSTILSFPGEVQERFRRPHHEHTVSDPRSPKVQLGGILYLGRIIDKIRHRDAGEIQDDNYLTVGFDRSLLDFLELDPSRDVRERRDLRERRDARNARTPEKMRRQTFIGEPVSLSSGSSRGGSSLGGSFHDGGAFGGSW